MFTNISSLVWLCRFSDYLWLPGTLMSGYEFEGLSWAQTDAAEARLCPESEFVMGLVDFIVYFSWTSNE